MEDEPELTACQDCRQEFQFYRFHAGHRVRCDDCNVKRRREKLEADPATARCCQCSQDFTYLAWFAEAAPKYCSDRCRKAARATYMRRYRARVRQAKRRPCQVCKKRRVLRWTSQGFTGSTVYADGTLCSPGCWAEWWKDKLLRGEIWDDYDDRIQGLLKLRATPEQRQVIEFYLDSDPEDVTWSAELDHEQYDNDDIGAEDELDAARVRMLVNLRRTDGTR
jgi:hypothetical protein